MCFHYSLTKERTEIEIQLGVHFEEEWSPIFHANGFSFLKMPVITQNDPGKIQLFNWGLIPHWIKTRSEADKLRGQTLNARSETVFEKTSFRSNISINRCLVIADGFYEWMDFNKKKYPHLIGMKNGNLFCFAGIYSNWTDKETGEHLYTFSILTTAANPMMARIHNSKERMPVIIPTHLYRKWLAPALNKNEVSSFFDPYPELELAAHTISKLISSRTQDSNVPEVKDPWPYPELALTE